MPSSIKLDVSTQVAGAGAKEDMSSRLSRLETLPAEVRRHLLSVLDFSQLKAFVHASPIFHSQYLHSRRFLLQKTAEVTLGTAMVDAYFAYNYSVRTADIANHDIQVVLPLYFKLTRQRCLPSTTKLTESDALGMLKRHRQIVEPLMEYSAGQMLECLAEQSQKQQPSEHRQRASYSNMEVARLTRAIYRFQLLHQVLIPAICLKLPNEDKQEVFVGKNIIIMFFSFLELWEIEELVSYVRFARLMCRSLCPVIYSENSPSSPARNLGRAGSPKEPMLLGARLVSGLLSRSQERIQLTPLDGQPSNVSESVPGDLSGVFDGGGAVLCEPHCQSECPRPPAQDLTFSFRGDTEPNAGSVAWSIIWRNLDDLIDLDVSDALREWGYVFWDATTLKDTGGMEVLEREWERLRQGRTSDSRVPSSSLE